MNNFGTDLDKHITGHYGEDQLSRPEPQDDDYVISDCRGVYFVTQLESEYQDYDETIAAIVQHANAAGYWPDVWFVNDHGNLSLLSINYATGETTIINDWV